MPIVLVFAVFLSAPLYGANGSAGDKALEQGRPGTQSTRYAHGVGPVAEHREVRERRRAGRTNAAKPMDGRERPNIVSVSNSSLSFKMIARTPAQMAAFYEGRGFPIKAVNALKDACFFTVIIKNRSRDILWLEPASWQINLASGKKVNKLNRKYWRKRWQQLQIPKSSQATFRWTLLPVARDLRPDESVGGNMVLQAVSGKINITPVFRIGAQGRSVLRMDTQTIRCAGR